MNSILISNTQGGHGMRCQEECFSERSVFLVAKQVATGLVSALVQGKGYLLIQCVGHSGVRASGLPAVRAQDCARERRSMQHADWLWTPGQSVRTGFGLRVEADRDGDSGQGRDSRSASEVAGSREATQTSCYSQE